MSKGISLHIGVNHVNRRHYGGWQGKLNACESDADSLHQLALSQGYKATVLKTRQATRKNVIEGIRSAAQTCEPGDIFLLTYSGHGGQIPDINHDEDDKVDETWVLFDGELIDDEIFHLWSQFKAGVRILVLSDSCHSGDVIRAIDQNDPRLSRFDGLHYRFLPHDIAVKTYRQNESFYQELGNSLPGTPAHILASVLLISACQDTELALDGVFNGLFTSTLLAVWKEGQFKGSYRDFYQAIYKRIPHYYRQHPNYLFIGAAHQVFENQTPFTI